MIYKDIALIILSLFVIFLIGSRYYIMATERDCGWNPINHFPYTNEDFKECWCLNEDQIPIAYAGFRCNCQEVCNTIQTQL